jgi:hypothetical protein
MSKQTAVEWLMSQVWIRLNMDYEWREKVFEQAKEMEEQQSHSYAEFAIRCDRMDMKILNFEDFVKLETVKI